ncbi:DUF2255 family protein [Salinibacterium soli]|uniref:DUF2255 family protein n=1 Tax=Antiquaquibacter soli TaxID=3064523 RepID=A0ABT9BQP3_9MICO|nr:DUF2255 family protein [Protaetiibacter sp. WY-16]MDO7882757.1 DUF2255 family protein [Protaetiibacter sp. WY-16]
MGWSESELAAVGAADELRIAPYRADGSLRDFVIIWVVRSGDQLFVRTAYRPESAWYRHAVESGRARIRAGGVERDVTIVHLSPDADHDAIDAAYHAKYDRYGANIVGTVVGDVVRELTLRLDAA